MVCPNCGHQTLLTPHYCKQCGWNFVEQTIQAAEEIRAEQDGRDYLYNPISHARKAVRSGFSWPFFLFGQWWCFFKGMWLPGLALMVFAGAYFFLVEQILQVNTWISLLIFLIPDAFLAFHANDFYRRYLLKRGWVEEAGAVPQG